MIPIVRAYYCSPHLLEILGRELGKMLITALFLDCRGGQYTAAKVISYRSPFTLIDVACVAAVANLTVHSMRLFVLLVSAVPP